MKLTKMEFLKYIISRPDAYAIQLKSGGYRTVKHPITDEILQQHMNHELTIGSYSLSKDSRTHAIVLDIDAHMTTGDTEYKLRLKQEKADDDLKSIEDYLTGQEYPYVLEASGSPKSYHIWIFIEETSGFIAKRFGNHIKSETGIDCEVFPKSDRLSEKLKFGNLVKMPLGKNEKNGCVSEVLVNGEFMSDFDFIEINTISIDDIEIPIKKIEDEDTKVISTKTNIIPYIHCGIRPCVERILLNPLHGQGDNGHYSRILIVREFASCGITDVDALARLFHLQLDYSEKLTKKYIKHILKTDMNRWRCETIRNRCGGLVDCSGCDHRW